MKQLLYNIVSVFCFIISIPIAAIGVVICLPVMLIIVVIAAGYAFSIGFLVGIKTFTQCIKAVIRACLSGRALNGSTEQKGN